MKVHCLSGVTASVGFSARTLLPVAGAFLLALAGCGMPDGGIIVDPPFVAPSSGQFSPTQVSQPEPAQPPPPTDGTGSAIQEPWFDEVSQTWRTETAWYDAENAQWVMGDPGTDKEFTDAPVWDAETGRWLTNTPTGFLEPQTQPEGQTQDTFTGTILAPSYILIGPVNAIYYAVYPVFADWSNTDQLAAGPSGELINVTRNYTVPVRFLGNALTATTIAQIELSYFGIGWKIWLSDGTFYRSDETRNNFPTDQVVVVTANSFFWMINLTRNQHFQVFSSFSSALNDGL
jgi:hypothetical protein